MRLVLAWLLVACSKKEAPPANEGPPPTITESEVKRGNDACADYIAKVCACGEKFAEQCKLARPYGDMIDVARAVALNPESKRLDQLQSAASIRNTVKKCIDESSKLAAAGCTSE